jgi:ubiquitin-conjugating enzyme E2 C
MMSSTPGISAFPESDSNLFHWLGTICGPDDTHYAGLTFKLKIDFPANYPFSAPTIVFTSPMWHPSMHLSVRRKR